jgi:hypothetical protein
MQIPELKMMVGVRNFSQRSAPSGLSMPGTLLLRKFFISWNATTHGGLK